MYQVYLKRNEDKRIRAGHAWVYANEVARIEGKGKNGELAAVYDFAGNFLGKGYINHLSKILVRVMIRDADTVADKAFFKARIKAANDYRLRLGCKIAVKRAFAQRQSLFLAHGNIAALIDAARRKQFAQRLDNERLVLLHAERQNLHREEVVILVHNQRGQPVRLAEYQAAAVIVSRAHYGPSVCEGVLYPAGKELISEGLVCV